MKTRMFPITLLSSFILIRSSLVTSQAAVVLTTLLAFDPNQNGVSVSSGVVQGEDGNYYGTTDNL